MEVIKAIETRRSVRRFKEDPFPDEVLQQLLQAGSMAPSAGNVQPWQFFVVRNKKAHSRLADAALGQSWMIKAPVIVVVCADLARSAISYGQRGTTLYALQDTAAAIENMLLVAVEEGLSSCWIGAFREEIVAELLHINPEKVRPVALVVLGYADETPFKPPKRKLEEVVHYID